jgi:hypothetical protein
MMFSNPITGEMLEDGGEVLGQRLRSSHGIYMGSEEY